MYVPHSPQKAAYLGIVLEGFGKVKRVFYRKYPWYLSSQHYHRAVRTSIFSAKAGEAVVIHDSRSVVV